MRLGVLFVLFGLPGCEVVFPLESPPPDSIDAPAVTGLLRGPSFTARVDGSTRLALALPTNVMLGDYVVGTVQTVAFTNKLAAAPAGWDVFDEFPDPQCTDTQWHASIVAARITRDTALAFEVENDDTVTGLFVSYRNAAAVVYLHRLTQINTDVPETVAFPSSEASPGSFVHVAQLADRLITEDPDGMNRIAAFDHLAAFDLEVPDGTIPPISIPVPINTCLGAVQLKVEP